MAQRFGGRFSPDGQTRGPEADRPLARTDRPGPHPFDGQRPSGVGLRANLLFALPFLFVWKAFTGNPAQLVLGLGAFVLMTFGAWLTREGIRAQDAYEARTVARRPAIPRKMMGSALTGAGLATAAVSAGQGPVIAALLGAIGAALHLSAFGPDPLRDKGAEGIDAFQSNRVAGAVDEAERHLSAMKDAILRANDRRMGARVDRFAAAARTLFRAVEADPSDLTAARKHLGVYLMGARDATVRYADMAARGADPKAKADYETLLDDLERSFAEATERLRANDHAALNVEIEVLRERLAREG
ncbi:MAG TPA: 5-bromo-4-chloroindolyl phosphate hydrolysis family protein [Paracoccaceae bacterium]|nr:5-bromo-4-chloroindolyl phosphate hydrolysis family protein [Paracoccaceae bacterium]HMO70941.1 5-bromo-4-chloroindolyl phosphate hydrolysis family protein [Paracoccaceae bacterium]